MPGAPAEEPTPAGAVLRSRGRRLLRALGLIILGGLPVLLLAFAVRAESGPVIAADQAVLAAATDVTRRTGLATALIILETVSHPVVVYLVGTGVAIWAWVAHGLRGRAIWAFCTMMVGWGVAEALKLVVSRLRPVLDAPITGTVGYSFPSGHALNITVGTTVLLVLLWPLWSTTGRVLATAAAALIVLAVGLDRIFLGVHFASDVVAGYLLGCCITFSSWIGFVGRTGATSSSSSSGRP